MAITNVEDSLQHFQPIASSGVDDSERTEDPRYAEQYQHRTSSTQARPVTALAADRFCAQQRYTTAAIVMVLTGSQQWTVVHVSVLFMRIIAGFFRMHTSNYC